MPSVPRAFFAVFRCAVVTGMVACPVVGGLVQAATAAPAAATAATAAAAPATPAKAVPLAPSAAQGTSTNVATTPATSDPMGDLRQRLAERLAGKGPKASAVMTDGPVEVVLAAAKPPAPMLAASAAMAVRANKAAGGGAATAVAHTSGGGASAKPHAGHSGSVVAHGSGAPAAHWAYAGATGPQAWGGLRPDFSLCAKGQRQSPIDIRAGLEVELEPVRFEYQASPFAVIDNGHTVQANIAGGNRIEVGGRKFELLQFHFHRPSEERIDGRQFEMSLHLVHKDDKGRLAVVALLLDKGPAQPAVQQVWNNLPLEKKEELRARTPLDLASLLPADRRHYTYMGSLTTPPCSEGVQWIVMRQPVTVSADQIELFARIYPMNARPLQQMAGRRILQSP